MTGVRERYAQTTRRALIDAAHTVFADREYLDVTAEELAGAADLTRGALYHHFDGKAGLFATVFEDLETDAAQRIAASMHQISDPIGRIEEGVSAFLTVCSADPYRHIVLQQGPIALGWQRWRELDRLHLGPTLADGARLLLEHPRIGTHSPRLVADAFYGALTELSLTIAETPDPARTRADAIALVRDLLLGLVSSNPAAATTRVDSASRHG